LAKAKKKVPVQSNSTGTKNRLIEEANTHGILFMIHVIFIGLLVGSFTAACDRSAIVWRMLN